MTTDEERESAIASLFACLKPGGMIFLDVREQRASRLRVDGDTRRVVADLGDRGVLTFFSRTSWHRGLMHVEERYELAVEERVPQVLTYDFTMRPWSRTELLSRLRRNGARKVEITAGVGRRTPDRLFVVAA